MENIFNDLKYHQGLGNHFVSETKEGVIHPYQNTPKNVKYNLYAEQLSGMAFTVPRHEQQRSWLYKIQPSVTHTKFVKTSKNFLTDAQDKSDFHILPNQLRFKQLVLEKDQTFIEGFKTYAGVGSIETKDGMNIYGFICNKSMEDEAFYNSDGDFLIVPYKGKLNIKTELGLMTVEPKEIGVIPRGIKFQVLVSEETAGWICEVYNGHFKIPDLGPIGANGLAAPKDFEVPTAWYEKVKKEYRLVNKYIGDLFEAKMDHSPFDVVGWHGNYYPFKYDMRKFNVVNSVSFDHLDPSIFTVLTVQSHSPGVAICDFVCFKERWMVAENTFRPPYYHRNVMSEFMGNICGLYDAKGKDFAPGCSSLHLPMTPHGPDKQSFDKGVKEEEKPVKYPDTMSFMFETYYMLKVSNQGMKEIQKDENYNKCWEGLEDNFTEQIHQ